MLNKLFTRLGFIFCVILLSILIVLPAIPLKIDSKTINIGGYYFEFFDGNFVVDLRDFKRGLDIDGGVKLVLSADMSKLNPVDRDAALESAKEVISRRVDLLGVTEPHVTTSKTQTDYRIIVEIPGVSDVASAVNLIGQTAQLNFRELKPEQQWDETKFLEFYTTPDAWQDTGINGADLKGVDVVFAQGVTTQAGKPQILLKFTDEGRAKFIEVAKRNIQKPIAMYLDNSEFPLSMPVVNQDLANGLVTDPIISGNFDVKTANALSLQLRAGALPVPVTVLEQKTIGASLGADSVEKSFRAGIVGVGLVLLFLVFSYRSLGVIASFALVIYSLITMAIFKLIPVTISLPGIAGFILSIGMAADANILVFERVKEEIFWGRSKSEALRLGFTRAWSSIKDSNFSSLITCAVLFYFGTGPVKGFALTLAIGILVSLFTSIFVTKTLINFVYLKDSNENN